MSTQPKERNLLVGFDFFSVAGGFAGFILMILNVFTVTLEVFIRRDMGQRYFNSINFYAGMIAFATMTFIANLISIFPESPQDMVGWEAGGGGEFSVGIFLVWILYIFAGAFHFLRQWFRDESGKPVHSLDCGHSVFEPLGKVLLKLINRMLEFPVRLLAVLIIPGSKEDLNKVLPVIKDPATFTYRVGEPIFLFIISIIIGKTVSTPIGIWIYISSLALLLSANFRAVLERNQVLDVRDQMIEAAEMRAAMSDTSDFMRIPHSTKKSLENIAKKSESSPELVENIKTFSPSVFEAMKSIDPNLQNLGKE